tara:strand:+ start:838 stop:1842 length:1005 start_codon:yes stop_codon:yes gene_type:complete
MDEEKLILGSEGNQSTPIITSEELLNSAKNELNRDVTKKDSEDIALLTEKFKEDKSKYAKGSKEEKAKLEADVVQTGDRIFKADSFRQELADEISNEEKIGHDPASKFPDHAKDFQAIMDGKLEVVYDDNNTPGYELNIGGFMPMQSILEMIKGNGVDQKSKEGLKVLIDNEKNLAQNANKTEGASFNYQQKYSDVMEKMIETGDIRSLATDKIFGNRVFKDDLMESIASGTYADLGFNEEQIKNMDPTPNDKITYEDATQITSSIMKDEDQLKNYLAEYYTNILEQNYYKNLHPDVRSAMDEKNKKPNLSTDGGIKVKGGTIQNGVFVPSKPS